MHVESKPVRCYFWFELKFLFYLPKAFSKDKELSSNQNYIVLVLIRHAQTYDYFINNQIISSKEHLFKEQLLDSSPNFLSTC